MPCPPIFPACAIADLPGELGDAVGWTILREIAEGCARAASYWIDLLGRAVAYTTRLDLTAPWFLKQYARMFAFAAVVTFGLLLKVCLTGAPRRRRPAPLDRDREVGDGLLPVRRHGPAPSRLLLSTCSPAARTR
jgi:hypothetical protein